MNYQAAAFDALSRLLRGGSNLDACCQLRTQPAVLDALILGLKDRSPEIRLMAAGCLTQLCAAASVGPELLLELQPEAKEVSWVLRGGYTAYCQHFNTDTLLDVHAF